MKNKMTVHNLMEVKSLIKESYARGDEENFNQTIWYTHSGEYLCTSLIALVDFELYMADLSGLKIEVL